MNARIPLALLALAVVFSLLGSPFFIPTAVVKAEDPAPVPITHRHINSFDKLAAVAENAGAMGASPIVNPASPICTIPSSGPNANTDCEAVAGLHNETTIAANPTNPNNRIGGANDYQIWASAGGWVIFYAFTRAHVTFDGGKTWTMVPIDYGGYDATGDPAVAFDASGNAYMATLGATWSHGYSGVETNPDVLVSRSADGGKSWSKPVRVAKGSGTVGSLGIFNDKKYIAAWGNGNAIVTWTVYNLGQGGSYINSPIYASVTHDAGRTWTAGVEISGSAQYCTGAQGGSACDQDQGSTPVMASDGSIFVSFISTYNRNTVCFTVRCGAGQDAYAANSK